MVIENNRGQPIASLVDWQVLAPPAAANHWREHRSAFELARAWTDGDAAVQLRALLAANADLGDVTLERAIAERKTRFDDIPGGPRNHDLLLLGRTGAGRIVVGIEAKADETFDRDLVDFCVAARRRGATTRAPERLDHLTRAFFATTVDADPSLGTLRYQLLSALAGTLAEAKVHRAAVAVLLIHEFVTPLTDPIKQQLNARDLDAFLARLGSPARIDTPDGSWLAGPFAIAGNTHLPADIPIYVGKLSTDSTTHDRGDSRANPHAGPTNADTPGLARAAAPPLPEDHAAHAANAQARPTPRHRAPIAVGGSLRVIKLNVHPPGCRCGCASKGERSFVLNRPGEHIRTRWTNDLDAVVDQIGDWTLEALGASSDAKPAQSPIEVGGGMTTITLTVHPPDAAARFVAGLPETGEKHEAQKLDRALTQIRKWTARAMDG